MRVELNVPDKVWATVLGEAEKNQTTVAGFVEAAIRDAIRPSYVLKLRAQARRLAITQAWGEGLTDAEIAERTSETNAYVASTRRAAKLPPNRLKSRATTPRKATT